MLFSTEDGTIAGWDPRLRRTHAVIAADQSGNGAVYKLLAMGTNGGSTFLYASNFHNGTVDVFDSNFHLVHFSPTAFVDPTTGPDAIPSDFAPFGVKNFNGTLFVTYAKQDAARHDDVEGVGNGFIDEFDTAGHFLRRFATRGTLNSPIGAAIAPAGFGPFGGDILIGNFGDSHVNVFSPSGQFLGQLSDTHGHPLVLNGGFPETNTKGLWGIGFGNGVDGAGTKSLFFAAGINLENDGLFGMVNVARHGHDDGTDDSASSPGGKQDDSTGNAAQLVDGTALGTPSVIPPPAGSPASPTAAPTGQVANATSDFVSSEDGHSTPDSPLFSAEDGTLTGSSSAEDSSQAIFGAAQ
jgi:uncharacterized protein (TIGR03118 family)